jgi:hypothetical protein
MTRDTGIQVLDYTMCQMCTTRTITRSSNAPPGHPHDSGRYHARQDLELLGST